MMMLLVKILFIFPSFLSNTGIDATTNKYYNSDFSAIEIVLNTTAEDSPENYIQSFVEEFEKDTGSKLYRLNVVKNIFTNRIYTSFLTRLLPFMIDVPPPVIK